MIGISLWGFLPKRLPRDFTRRGMIMKKFLILILMLGVIYCPAQMLASADAETITFDKAGAGGTVDKAHLSDFTVSVAESVKVSSVELVEDGVSLGEDTEAPFSFALKTGKLGTRKVEAIVRDESGAYIYAEKEFTVVEYTKGTLCSADFKNYTGGAATVGTSHWVNEQGSPTAFDRGDENGICLKLSYPDVDHSEHNCSSKCDSWPQFRHSGNSSDKLKSTNIHFETDFYIDQPEKGTGRGWSAYSWNAYGPTAGGNKSNSIASVSANESGATLKCGEQSFPINQRQWYRIVLEYDWVSGNTSLWVDGVQLVKNVILPRTNELTSLTWLQGGGSVYGGSVCFDNWEMYMILSSPCSTGLIEGETHTYTEESVTLGLTQGISAIDTTALTLTNEIGEVEIEYAEISTDDKTITVKPVGGFLPSNTYELTIPAKTVFTAGTITEPLVLRFKTSPEATDVVSGKIKKGADVSFSAELINTSGETKTLTAYLCSYKNGVFYKLTKAKTEVTSDGLKIVATTAPIEKGDGMTYKAFVADENGKPVTDKFYTLTLK